MYKSMKARTLDRITTRIVLVAALFVLSHSALAADTAQGAESPRQLAIELGAPLSDSMVLQREMYVPVWGWRKPGTHSTARRGRSYTPVTLR